MSDSLVIFDHVGKSYDGGKSFAVRGADLTIRRGEIVVMLGSSGSGKSTLLKMINGLILPTEGQVTVHGRSGDALAAPEHRRSIGYVSQGVALFPFLKVGDNIGLPMRLQGDAAEIRQKKVRDFLELVEMPTEFADRLPADLSGGQQQRVGVARALITGTDLVLMDEPFGALDLLTRESLQKEVLRLRDKLGVTIVFVTHDLFEALTLADRIVVMHEGRIEQTGKPDEILNRPATEFVQTLFEKPKALLSGAGGPR